MFDPIDPFFDWFKIFLTPYFHKTLDPTGSNIFHLLNPATENLIKYPHHPLQGKNVLVIYSDSEDIAT